MNVKKMIRWLTLGTGLLAIAGCESVPAVRTLESPAEQPTAAEAPPTPAEKAPVATRPFTPETMYALLVAELAKHRRQPDIALGNYLEQAHLTKDPGVAREATRLAKHLRADQATLNGALLWAELDPTAVEAHQTAAFQLIKKQQFGAALEHLESILSLQGKASFDFLAAASLSLPKEQLEVLLDKINELAKRHPDQNELLYAQAVLLHQTGRVEESSDIAKPLSKHDDYPQGLLLYVKLLKQAGQDEHAFQETEKALEKHPDFTRLILFYGQQLIERQQASTAHQVYRDLANKNPLDGNTILSIALILKDQQSFDESIYYLNHLVQIRQHSNEANFHLGKIYSQIQGQWRQATDHYSQVKPSRFFLPAIAAASEIFMDQNQPNAVDTLIEKARQQLPSASVQLFALQSDLLMKRKDFKRAESILGQGLAQHKHHFNLLYSRAMVFEATDRIDLMEKDLRTIIRLDPNNSIALNALGYTLADRTTRFKEALVLIEKAHKLKPNDAAYIDSLGWVHYKLGNLEKAAKYLQQAFNMTPDHEIAAHLGEVLWEMGQREKALKTWKLGLENKPESDILARVMKKYQVTVESLSKIP